MPPHTRPGTSPTSTATRAGPIVATFDVDQFHDYRARRPAMSFVRDHYESYDAPRLVVRLLHDSGGTPYLLLHGPEPDNRWEAFARAVREVLERLGVTRVVAMGSVPMAVPHTRPIAITPHANRPELVPGASPWRGELRIPSSAQSLLEVRLGEWGHDMLGFVAHIPHYLAQLDYPKAAAVLLEQVELAGRLTIDLTELHELARERETEIERYLSSNEEVGEVVEALEQQYDAFERAEGSGASLLADDEPLPTGEEIGRQFEQFLAGLDTQDGNDPNESGAGLTRERRLAVADLLQPARPRDARRRPLPRRPAAVGPGPGLRRAGGRAGAGGRHPQRRPGVRPALVPLLLPAARRLRGADHLRRAADPGRPLVPHPPGHGPPARPADLPPDHQLPAARGGLRPPGRRCPTCPAPTRGSTSST